MKKLFLLFIAILPLAATAQPSLSGYTYLATGEGKYYYVSNVTATWGSALTAAQAAYGGQGNLASFHDLTVNNDVASAAYTVFGFGLNLYVGGYISTGWNWVDGSPMSFTHWQPPRPIGLPVMTMNSALGIQHGFWNDLDANSTRYYIIQIPVILAVEMTSFTAIGNDQSVTLRWHTETETNNSHFNIYRSLVADERGELLTRISGHGSTPTANDYSFVDSRVINGTTYYYRISDVSLDGTESAHNFVVNATPAANTLAEIPIRYCLSQNFPNPFNPSTEISYKVMTSGNVELAVYNLGGQVVAKLVDGYRAASAVPYSVKFDASHLPTGVYYYTLKANGFATSKKMVLIK